VYWKTVSQVQISEAPIVIAITSRAVRIALVVGRSRQKLRLSPWHRG